MATRGLYKRGNVWWIRYVGIDGRTVFESSRSVQFRVAETVLIKRKQSIKEGKMPEVIKITNHMFNELTEEYGKWAEKQRCYNTKKIFISQLKKHFGNIPLRRFGTMLVEQFQSGKLNAGKKPATCNRLLATLKHMFTKAVDWNMVEEEVLKRIRKVKFLEENNSRLKYLSTEQCKALIDACSKHVKPIIITALNTGMRKEEILGLTWDNVDLRHGFILLGRTKNGERREIPINDTLKETLKGITRRLDVPYVFYDAHTGKRYNNVYRAFYSACKRAGILDFHFHDLRHTFASQLIMAGVDITTVKELLGHKSLFMTMRYAHLAPAHKVHAVDILDSKLNEVCEKEVNVV